MVVACAHATYTEDYGSLEQNVFFSETSFEVRGTESRLQIDTITVHM